MAWVFLIVAILAEVIATSALKASDGMTRLAPAILTVAGYAVSFYFLGLAFRSIPLGIAYAMWAGLGIVSVTLIGIYWFEQPISLRELLGIGLILAGVIVIRLNALLGFSSSV